MLLFTANVLGDLNSDKDEAGHFGSAANGHKQRIQSAKSVHYSSLLRAKARPTMHIPNAINRTYGVQSGRSNPFHI